MESDLIDIKIMFNPSYLKREDALRTYTDNK